MTGASSWASEIPRDNQGGPDVPEYEWEKPLYQDKDGETTDADEDSELLPGFVFAGLVIGSLYTIGRQDNGEKILGTFWLMAGGMSHSGKTVQSGLFLLSLYNFIYLTRGDVTNLEVAQHNLIGMTLITIIDEVTLKNMMEESVQEKGLNYGVYINQQVHAPMLGIQLHF